MQRLKEAAGHVAEALSAPGRSAYRDRSHGTRVRSAWRAAADADAIILVLDAHRQVHLAEG